LVTKIQIDAMSRADIAREDRRDFYLYIDEFQNFATKAFATILSEARKYRLSLIVANQFTSQLQEEVKDAIFGNV
jgi:type IV secretory pathway TraG/TraD family ATPase VirD4